MTRRMTDQQVRAVVYRIAQTYLEVERGLRPPDHLASFLTRLEYQRHRAAPRPSQPRLGPVQLRELGRIHLRRLGEHRISAGLLTRRGEDRWGALLIHLRNDGNGWQVNQLERLERAVMNTPPGVSAPPPAGSVDRRIRFVEEERRLVEAAHRATAARIDDIGDRRTRASRELEEQLGRWAGHLTELARELETLRTAHELRGDVAAAAGTREEPELRGDVPVAGTAAERDPGYETKVAAEILGARPDHLAEAAAWDRAAADIRSYRERWALDEDDPPLGPPPLIPEQAAERRTLIRRIHALRVGQERASRWPDFDRWTSIFSREGADHGMSPER